MKVLKFGGTSLGNVQRFREVAGIVSTAGKNIVVLSAMAGTTNTLVEIAGYLYNRNLEGARDTIASLEKKYLAVVEQLYSTKAAKDKARSYVKEVFLGLVTFTKELFGEVQERLILAQGELLSSFLLTLSWRSRV